jgi:hypothetical protein
MKKITVLAEFIAREDKVDESKNYCRDCVHQRVMRKGVSIMIYIKIAPIPGIFFYMKIGRVKPI